MRGKHIHIFQNFLVGQFSVYICESLDCNVIVPVLLYCLAVHFNILGYGFLICCIHLVILFDVCEGGVGIDFHNELIEPLLYGFDFLNEGCLLLFVGFAGHNGKRGHKQCDDTLFHNNYF